MTYDPHKVEEWVVGSSGFWRKGDVNTDRFFVAFTGTWEQVKAKQQEMIAMEQRHYDERKALEAQQLAERRTLWPDA